ncbi:MAG: PD-(D/E)XK nuclease family protein [Ignavibacteria bacterium]|nr:PD-(D/E)XK nuclease family protein [Ignavibacteria bacterium]
MENFELIQPYYSELKSPHKIYRSRIDKERYYFTIINNEILRVPSVTTILDATLPVEDWLIRWIARWGYERAMEKKVQAGHYGTLFSLCVAEFLKNKSFDLETIPLRIQYYREENNIDFPTDFWDYKLREDLYSLACFFADYQFKPLAIELPLVSKTHLFAGTIDAFGLMRTGTGVNGKILKKDIVYNPDGSVKEDKTKISYVIIDWKTGRHGFYRSHEAQLHFYKLLLIENFPDLANKNILLYNWAPKEWINPDDQKYTIKDQTESNEKDKILHYLQIFKIDEKQKDFTFKKIEGVLNLGEVNGNLKTLTYADLVREKLEVL